MSLLKRLFGGSAPAAPDPVEHEGYLIIATPEKGAGGYRIGARIEKVVGDDTLSHAMIRADTYAAADQATEASINKAMQMIDQMGDDIFR